ncbi:hypothetical protein BX666DRAFT_2079555, partial [Dichotomocladium elegans]
PKTLSSRDKRQISRTVRRAPFDPYDVHRESIPDERSLASTSAIRRELKATGFISSIPALKPASSDLDKEKRFFWAKAHIVWTMTNWSTVIRSDESRFLLRHNDWWCKGHPYEGRKAKPRLHSIYIQVWQRGGHGLRLLLVRRIGSFGDAGRERQPRQVYRLPEQEIPPLVETTDERAWEGVYLPGGRR